MADNDDDKTVVETTVDKPETVKPIEDVPPPVTTDTEPPKDDVRDLVKNLSDKVDELTNTVNSLMETGGERDSVPGGSVPWTAKRWF